MPNVPVQQPTGNAMTDATVTVDPTLAAAAINLANTSAANVASDCLWPSSSQFSIPIIPGIYSQSVNFPCLITYSEARALIGAGLIVGGLLLAWGGFIILGAVEALPFAVGLARRTPEGAAAGAVANAAAPAAPTPKPPRTKKTQEPAA